MARVVRALALLQSLLQAGRTPLHPESGGITPALCQKPFSDSREQVSDVVNCHTVPLHYKVDNGIIQEFLKVLFSLWAAAWLLRELRAHIGDPFSCGIMIGQLCRL